MESRDWPLSPREPQAGSLLVPEAIDLEVLGEICECSGKRRKPSGILDSRLMATSGIFLTHWRNRHPSCVLFLIEPVTCGCVEVWTSKNLGLAREGGRDRAVKHPSSDGHPTMSCITQQPPPSRSLQLHRLWNPKNLSVRRFCMGSHLSLRRCLPRKVSKGQFSRESSEMVTKSSRRRRRLRLHGRRGGGRGEHPLR